MTESTKIDYVSIVQDLRDEADLCRNETATDIADLLDDAASCIVAMKSQFVALRADLAAAQEWREAVLNELIVAHIYTKEHDTNPRKAIQDAINWNCQIALDPAVSSDARKLIAAAREARQRAEALAERRLAEAQALVKDHATILDALERAEALAEQNAKDAKEAIAIAGFLFDAWEDGTPCFETDGESGMGASIGKAFKLSNEDFTRCTEFLNRVDPHGAAIDAARAK